MGADYDHEYSDTDGEGLHVAWTAGHTLVSLGE